MDFGKKDRRWIFVSIYIIEGFQEKNCLGHQLETMTCSEDLLFQGNAVLLEQRNYQMLEKIVITSMEKFLKLMGGCIVF